MTARAERLVAAVNPPPRRRIFACEPVLSSTRSAHWAPAAVAARPERHPLVRSKVSAYVRAVWNVAVILIGAITLF